MCRRVFFQTEVIGHCLGAHEEMVCIMRSTPSLHPGGCPENKSLENYTPLK